jgi:hypothetical protein
VWGRRLRTDRLPKLDSIKRKFSLDSIKRKLSKSASSAGSSVFSMRHSIRHSRRRAKFLVVSNMRCGSTWVLTSLGALSDVQADYELKWGAVYKPSPVHIFLDHQWCRVSEILEDLDTDAPVTGSKLVFDPKKLTQTDFKGIAKRIGPDVSIVHVTRRYRDIFLSVRRGYYHSLDAERADQVGSQLRHAIAAADYSDVTPEPGVIAPERCERELANLLANDRRVRDLAKLGFRYLQVDYDDFFDRFEEVARFIGSEAERTELEAQRARPLVKKLPPIDTKDLIANSEALESTFQAFEALRQEVVLSRAQ